MAKRPSTTMAVAIIATVTRRVTAKSAIDTWFSGGQASEQSLGFRWDGPQGDVPGLAAGHRRVMAAPVRMLACFAMPCVNANLILCASNGGRSSVDGKAYS